MEILLAVLEGQSERELVVSIDAAASVGDLSREMGGAPGSTLVVRRTGTELDPAAAVVEADLVSGDEVSIVTPGPGARSPHGGNPAVLTFLTGPQRGERIHVVGSVSVGRDESADVAVGDPLMSRLHARFSGEPGGGMVVQDLGSSNGTAVDGTVIDGPVTLAQGSVVTCGTTQFEVHLGTERRSAATRRSEGTIGFSRPPRVVPERGAGRVAFPSPPLEIEARKIPVIATVAPVVMAGIMSVFAGPIMLVFALISPVMMLANRWEEAKSGKKAQGKELELFRADAAESVTASSEAALLSHRRRHEAQPDARTVLDRVETLHPSLWERRADDKDALTLRVGTADQPTLLDIAGGPATEDSRDFAVELLAHMESLRTDIGVPFTVDLSVTPVVGVVGNTATVADTLRWMVAQAVTQNSPNDLALCVVAPGSQEWGWTRWLPHARTLRTDAAHGRTVATDDQDARGLVAAIEALVAEREIIRSKKIGQESVADVLPRVLLVVPDGRSVSEASLTGVLERGSALGVTALIGSSSVDNALGVARNIVDVVGGNVIDVRTGSRSSGIAVEGIDERRALRLARRLSPVRDTTQRSASGEVPQSVLLRDLIGLQDPTPSDLIERWDASRGSSRLDAPIGVGAAGPVSLDLRVHGPHGLVAGTTGAGKSELLQSLVVSLAAHHSPKRLNFVLIDYKGGAAFKDCVDLPHTVGFFTDLDSHLAVRALVSLNAELKRREHILAEFGAKDIVEMEEMRPDEAPANLVLVFDEFAFLKRTVPEFVAGVIDIAQRGRSLGVHLILATQRPSGVIDENIRANTNLRIALRVADQGDSEDVLDRPDAVSIPKSIPGRAFVKTGPSEVRQVQTAYANARRDTGGAPAVGVSVLGFDQAMSPTRGVRGQASRVQQDGPTDLQRLVTAIRQAAVDLHLPAQPVPWLDPLPSTVTVDSLGVMSGSETSAAIGMVDLPDSQSQVAWEFDPARDGHLVVFGASGAGKSTLLRTIAVQFASRLAPGDLELFVVDFASRSLGSLSELPQCGGVINADEGERLDRLFTHLESTVSMRKTMLAEWGVSSVAEARAAGRNIPYALVMIDGFANFYSTHQMVDHGELVDKFLKLLSDGRATGVFFVVTGDRRNAVPSSVTSLMSARLVMRMGEPDEYVSLGLSGDLGRTEIPPGRGFTVNRQEVQVAIIGDDPTGAGQNQRVRDMAARLGPRHHGLTEITPLADHVPRGSLVARGHGIPLGLLGESGATVTVDLVDSPVFAVFGPERSGRTTALTTLVLGLHENVPTARFFLASPRRSQLLDLDLWEQAGRGVDGADSMLVELAAEIRDRGADTKDVVVLVVDDGEEMTDGAGASALTDIIKRSRDAGVIVLAAVSTSAAHRSFGGWVSDLKRQRHAVALCPDIDVDGDLLGVRFPRKSSRRYPPGRGYAVSRGGCDYVQVAES